MSNPLYGYEAHEWSTYVITIPEGMLVPTRPLSPGTVTINSDSPEAVKLAEADNYDASRMFFFDFEQLSAGHNVYPCGPLCELASEYEGHPEGKLAFVSYEGMDDDEVPCYTFYVQN